MKNKYLLLILFLLLAATACSDKSGNTLYNIIPEPVSVEADKGRLSVGDNITLAYDNAALEPAARYLDDWISRLTDCVVSKGTEGDIVLRLDANNTTEGAYRLSVSKSGIEISAGDYCGIAAGIATLRQLFPHEAETENPPRKRYRIPFVRISDAPRFGWRAVHLDVARHFFDKEEAMRLLDAMALYKFNKLHFHLTDDQGWRLESERYPLLTENGAWREPNNHDRACAAIAEKHDNPGFRLPAKNIQIRDGKEFYGGYFSREEIAEIVEYAAARGIDIIPEIDMPGHSTQAIANYPHLSCFEKPDWGEIFSAPLCPGKDGTLEFCKNIYKEVFTMFPCEYVHLGADEVDYTNWMECPDCRQRMEELGISTGQELQAWFVDEMSRFFTAHGRKLIGWDEIAAGTTPENSAITWWRNWAPETLRNAAGQGREIIMTPNVYCYLDYPESNESLEKIYGFDPIPADFTPEQAQLIKGIQGNLWTEWIPSFEIAGYQYFPRLLALSEVAWGAAGEKDFDRFHNRTLAAFKRLDALGIDYRLPEPGLFHQRNVFTDEAMIDFTYPAEGVAVRYTTDGSLPNADSPEYTGRLVLTESTDLTLRLFRPDGRPSDFYRAQFIKSGYLPAVEPDCALADGLSATWHAYRGSRCEEIDAAPRMGNYITDGIAIPPGVRGDIGLVFDGYIDIPEDGIYTFYLNSDDGSILDIDGQRVIDNDGGHSPVEITGQAALAKGLHRIHARYFDHNGGQLEMGITDRDGKRPLPDGQIMFRHSMDAEQ